MKKGCYFIGAPGGTGAVARHFAALGLELARRGNHVKIISSLAEANGEHNGSNLATIAWPSARPTRVADALFLAKLIHRYRPDCMVANFAAVNWMCLIGWLCRVRNRIAFYHTLSTQIDGDHNPRHHLLSKINTLRKRLVYKTATAIVGISDAALQDAQNAYGVPPEKCRLWRYSMPDPAHWLTLLPAEAREDLVVCAGRLYPSKGQDILIAALAQGLDSVSSARVEFFGSGPLLDSYRQMAGRERIASRCSFIGKVSNEEVLKRMSRAKVTVVPSRNEAFGLVNIESMAVATPVIASRVGGIPEIVRDGVDGFLVPPGDPTALAEKLALLVRDCALRERLGRNARQRFLEKYGNCSVVQKQVDWLDRIVQRGELEANHGS